MNIRKLLALILTLAAALSLFAGCGEEKAPATTQAPAPTDAPTETVAGTAAATQEPAPEGYITTKEAFLEKMESLLDMSKYGEVETDDKNSWFSFTAKSKADYGLDFTVKFGDGTTISLPCSYADLEKQGWMLTADPEQELEANHIAFGSIKNATKQKVNVDIRSPRDKSAKYQDCSFASISFNVRDGFSCEWESDAPTFTVCETITENSTLEELIDTLGSPYHIYFSQSYSSEGEYLRSLLHVTFEQADGSYLEFHLSGDTGLITEIHYDAIG